MKIDGMSGCQAGRVTEFGGRESEERMTKEAKMAAGHAPWGRPTLCLRFTELNGLFLY